MSSWAREWDATIAAIGQDFSKGAREEAIETVDRSAIRRFCEPLELDCPLHYDDTIARQHGYRGVVAPWSSLSHTFSRGGHWRPGMPTRYPTADRDALIPNTEIRDEPGPPQPPYSATFATDIEIDYGEPVYVGDKLTRSGWKLVAVVPKATNVGRGAFVTFESYLHNQRGELVATLRSGSFRYTPGASAATPTADRRPAEREIPPAVASQVDWSSQRFFEDVGVGDELPPLAIPLTVARLVVEAGASLDFSRVHHNADVARATGASEMYADNVFIQGWWERAVREYIGLAGKVRRVGPLRMRIFNTVGETVVTRGTVRRMWSEGGESLAELELRSEISSGVSVGPGPVIVTLPSREG